MHNERNNAQMHTPKYAPMLLYEIKYIKNPLTSLKWLTKSQALAYCTKTSTVRDVSWMDRETV